MCTICKTWSRESSGDLEEICRGQSDLRESAEELQWHNAPQIDKHTNSSNHNQLTLSASPLQTHLLPAVMMKQLVSPLASTQELRLYLSQSKCILVEEMITAYTSHKSSGCKYNSVFHQPLCLTIIPLFLFFCGQKWFLVSHPRSENPDSPLVSPTQDPANTQGKVKSNWRVQVFGPRLPTSSRSRLLWEGGWSTEGVRRM